MKIKWLGHSAFMIENKKKIVIDPFLTGNPKSAMKAADIKCDIVVVTHGHGDHMGDALLIAKKNNALFVSTYELANYASSKGVKKTEGINIGGTLRTDGVEISMVQAMHSSGLSSENFRIDGGISTGVIIKDGKSVYHTGDTGVFFDMKLVQKLYEPEIMLLPIDGHFNMNYKAAAMAVEFVKPEYAIPMHYDTFPLIEVNPQDFAREVKKLHPDTKVVVMNPGQEINI